MNPIEDPAMDTSAGVTRRRFLAGAGVAAGTVAVISTADLAACSHSGEHASTPDLAPIEHGVLDSLAESRAPRLSIGYIERSARHTSLATAVGSQVRSVPASQLVAGSPGLSGHPIRVRVLGLTPGGDAALAAKGVTMLVDVVMPAATAALDLPFFAWSFRPRPIPTPASPTEFTVAAARSHRFAIRVEARAAAPHVSTQRAVTAASEAAVAGAAVQVLTSGFGRGLAKLRPGLYLVGLDHEVWNQPQALPGLDAASWRDRPSVVIAVSAASA